MGLHVDPTVADDRQAADWLLGRLTCGPSVGAWIPDGFESLVRILHPAERRLRTDQGTLVHEVQWKEISAWSGKVLTRDVSFDDLERRSDGATWLGGWKSPPLGGQLEPRSLLRLTQILSRTTSTPEAIWFLVWHGYLDQVSGEELMEVSRSLTDSGRKYVLRTGRVGSAQEGANPTALLEPPTFWWPQDRSWFVATDIDSTSTYVAGRLDLVERLLADPLLEGVPASLEDPYDGHASEETPATRP